ncbi:MAG TPA: ABC transporter permease [Methylomusa anaerophila]|uniref:Nickel import system permease protein NikB n=1 Tax=Methylomusa anaerophila TaxID=1930071 RepID=A0A348AEG2_9FIRM|nr:nickel ABC transporter permease [Methylomusa anaerophila]BBB89460.1 nickel transport system permease protein NikB [Methylomusa anaerophila]HML89692.1 ABC transporter permease [Methylomusa anaerophila]
MSWYVFVRLAGLAPTAIIVTFACFAIIQLTPGDPAVLLLQQRGLDPTPEEVAVIRDELHLDRPFGERYVLWLWQICQGDLGVSFYTRQPVATEILQHIPATLELTAAAMFFSLIVAFGLGLLSAKYENKIPDFISRIYALLAVSMPSYWLGLLFIYFFAVKLQLLPAVGRGGFLNLILPAVTLGFSPAAVHARLLRNSLLEVLSQEFMLYARAKGLTVWQALLHHGVLPSLAPVVTSLGTTFGYMLGGTVIIESIFAWPGLGKMVMDAIFNRDYPVIQGYILVMAMVYTLVNVGIDLLCVWFDPRMRLGGDLRK